MQDNRVIALKAQLEKNKKCVEEVFSDAFPMSVSESKERLKIAQKCVDTGVCVDELKEAPKSELKKLLAEEKAYFRSLNPKISTLIDTQLNCDGFPGRRGIAARIGLIEENGQTTAEVLEVQLIGKGKK